MKLQLLSLTLLVLTNSGCVTVKEATLCSAAAVLPAGANCSRLIGPEVEQIGFDDYVDFLEAKDDRPDPANPGQTLPAKPAAVCMSADDFSNIKTEIEILCRMAGKRCSYEVRGQLDNLGIVVEHGD